MLKLFSGTTITIQLTILAFFAILPGGARAQSASGKPDLSGVWVTPGNRAVYALEEQASVMQPAAKQKFDRAQHGPNAALDFSVDNDPYVRYCDPLGVPRILLANHPFKIVQGAPDELIILYERSRGFREIYMDGREHPKDLDPSWWGHSIGKWDGDTLVIDSVGFNDRTWVDYMGLPHSDALHVVERYHRAAPNTLQLDLTIDDPQAYTKPWSTTINYELKPWDLGEDICTLSEEENFEQHLTNTSGATPVKK
jgi:hypothetical protein